MRTLLADALNNIPPEAFPQGTQQTQINWLNAVCNTFLTEAKPKDSVFRWRDSTTGASFAIYYDSCNQAFITLKRNMLSLLASAYGQTGVNNPPSFQVRFSNAEIKGPWAEFGNGAYGVGDQIWGRGMMDWGDNWTTFQDFPNAEPSYLRIVTEQSEAGGASILFRGVDQNGNEIYSGTAGATIKGVNLVFGSIAPPSFSQTTQVFGEPPSLVQKPVTYGPLSLYSVGMNTGTVALIAIYDPGDTSPGFRRYKLGGMQFTQGQQIPYTTLHSMVKRRFVPAIAQSDELIPGNIEALTMGLIARGYDLQRDPGTSHAYWSDAFGILNAEVAEFRGAAVPRLVFQKGTSIGAVPFIN
jgi:hypothetical protein